MAVSAKFIADFSSFSAAVQKAEVELRSFETNANKVERSLDKMTNSFTGRHVIQEANLMASAVDRVGGATRLTEQEQRRVNAAVTEALAKYKALGMEAPKSLTDLANATKHVAANTEKIPAPVAESALSFKQLFGAFSAANIATAALGKVTAEIGDMVAKGQRLPAIQQGFERLAIGVKQDSSEMLSALQTATKGMVSEFDLMQSANKALLLGLPVTKDSMGDMAAAATALGRAMGLDATKSLDDLITALGRSSPMILDNLGLTVKLGDANEAYAAKLGKAASELTEAEKKIAFYEAAMEAARKKTAELGEQTKTLSEIMTTVWTSVSNQVTRAAGDFNVGVGRMFSSWENFKRALEGSGGTPGGAIAAAAEQERAEALARTLRDQILKDTKGFGSFKTLAAPLVDVERIEKELIETEKKWKKAVEDRNKAMDEAATKAVRQFKDVHAAMAANEDAYRRLLQRGAAGAFSIVDEQQLAILHDTVEETRRWIELWTKGLPIINGVPEALDKISATGIKPVNEIAITAAKANLEFEQQQQLVFGLADAFGRFGSIAGGTFGNILNDIGNVIDAFGRAADAAATIKAGLAGSGWKGAAHVGMGLVDGASSVWQATSSGNRGSRVAGGALTGAKVGMAFGPWGAAIGAAAGAITGWVRGMNQGRKAVKEFAESFGGFDQLHRRLGVLGDEGERMWRSLTQGTGNGNPEQAARVIGDIQKALQDAPAKLNEMVAAAMTGGKSLDAAMAPYLEDLIRAGQLTEENANLLMGLPAKGIPAFAEVEAAAEALGLNIDSIGQSIKQLGFTDSAEAIAKNLDILARAGADMDAVLTGSRDKIQKLVDDAQKYGFSLPEAIRPFLQQMSDAGKLTDLFGEKLTDLDDLHFTKPLEQSVDDLIKAMYELVGVIRDDVGGALDDLGKRVVRPRVEPQLDGSRAGGYRQPVDVNTTVVVDGDVIATATANAVMDW